MVCGWGRSGSSGVVGDAVGVGEAEGLTGGVLVAGGLLGPERSASVGVGVAGSGVGNKLGRAFAGPAGSPAAGAEGNGVVSALLGVDGLSPPPGGIGGRTSLGPHPGWPAIGLVVSAPPPGSGISGAPIRGPPSRLITTSTA
jgi:hypothetical protein